MCRLYARRAQTESGVSLRSGALRDRSEISDCHHKSPMVRAWQSHGAHRNRFAVAGQNVVECEYRRDDTEIGGMSASQACARLFGGVAVAVPKKSAKLKQV